MNIRKIVTYSGIQPSDGTNTFDIDLGDNSSTYIIQSLNIFYEIIGGTPSPNMVVQAWDGTTANIIVIDNNIQLEGVSNLITREFQAISKKRYIRLSYTGQSGDTFKVCISYFKIPNSASLSSNFLVSAGQGFGFIPILTNSISGKIFTIKSVYISLVPGQPTASLDVDIAILDNSTGVDMPISRIVDFGSSYKSFYTLSNKILNMSLETGDVVQLATSGSSLFQYYVSYVYDLLDT